MKAKVVSFEVAKKLVETGFIGKSYLKWEIDSDGKAQLQKSLVKGNVELISMNEIKPSHTYPAYNMTELFYEMYSVMQTSPKGDNSIPVLILNLSGKLESKEGRRKLLKNPADFIARQFLSAMHTGYMLSQPKDRSFSFSD